MRRGINGKWSGGGKEPPLPPPTSISLSPPLGLGGPCLGNRPLLYLKTTDVFGGDLILELRAASPGDKGKAGAELPPASFQLWGIQVRTRRLLAAAACREAPSSRAQRLGGWPLGRACVRIRSSRGSLCARIGPDVPGPPRSAVQVSPPCARLNMRGLSFGVAVSQLIG